MQDKSEKWTKDVIKDAILGVEPRRTIIVNNREVGLKQALEQAYADKGHSTIVDADGQVIMSLSILKYDRRLFDDNELLGQDLEFVMLSLAKAYIIDKHPWQETPERFLEVTELVISACRDLL